MRTGCLQVCARETSARRRGKTIGERGEEKLLSIRYSSLLRGIEGKGSSVQGDFDRSRGRRAKGKGELGVESLSGRTPYRVLTV